MFGARLAEPSSNDIIAERVFERATARGRRPIAFRIGRPETDRKDPTLWTCAVEFLGMPGRRKVARSTHGVDQVQALLLAFELIEYEVDRLRAAGHVITWLGEADLGLPSRRREGGGDGGRRVPAKRNGRRRNRRGR
jgi:hypothetical protein